MRNIAYDHSRKKMLLPYTTSASYAANPALPRTTPVEASSRGNMHVCFPLALRKSNRETRAIDSRVDSKEHNVELSYQLELYPMTSSARATLREKRRGPHLHQRTSNYGDLERQLVARRRIPIQRPASNPSTPMR